MIAIGSMMTALLGFFFFHMSYPLREIAVGDENS